MRCPDNSELLQLVTAGDTEANTAEFSRHIDACATCKSRVAQLLETIDALRTTRDRAKAGDACLSDAALADLADSFDLRVDVAATAHLAQCADCRARFASLKALLSDPAVSSEVALLERRRFPRITYILPAGLAATAATVLLIVMLRPPTTLQTAKDSAAVSGQRREGVVTNAGAPRIIAPSGQASSKDSLQWTSVPRADLYRITVWDLGGVVIWEGETRDTILALPAALRRQQEMTYVWVVDARTGFDRWVSSESGEFTLRVSRGGRR